MPRLTQVRRVSVWIASLAVVILAGCSRQAFRERTDKDVEAIISQKNVVPQWQVQNWHAYPDPRARFADPSCPDFPPYPPDDYAAKVLSPNPQRPGRGGVGRNEGDGYLKQIIEWDTQNRAEDSVNEPSRPQPPEPTTAEPLDAASTAYQAAFATNERAYRIRLDQAVELALYNSREFQDRREDLYLAALPVSLERFGFSAQAFAAEQVILQAAGRETANPGNRWQIGTSGGISRRFSTGATLLVQLANQIVIDLGNGRPTVSTGTLGFTFIQPLLRGGGFAVTLEALTLAERTLLYAIRSYARFRSIFYVAIAAQGDYTNNPYGLQGLSANLGRGIGANLTANQIGYLPTILRSAILANERNNVAAFVKYLRQFQNLEEGGAVTKLQVGRIEQQLLQGRTTVLQRTQEYVDNIDNFKLQLGLPATLPLELDETPLKPIREQLRRIEQVYEQFRDLEVRAGKFDPIEEPSKYRERWRQLLTESPLTKGTRLSKDIPERSAAVKSLSTDALSMKERDFAEQRRKLQDVRADKLNKNQTVEAENRQIDFVEAELDLIRFEMAFRVYESKPWAGVQDQKKREADQAGVFRGVLNAGMLVAVPARNQRLEEIRTQWPQVPPLPVDDQDVVTVPLDEAYQKVAGVALNNRLDLMNARAQVVDAWRQVTIRANALQGVFDVEYDLNTNSPIGQNRPLGLGGSRTLHQVRLRIEPPFVRREERNLYRAALIAYQRQRRNLMAFEDNIVTDVRTDLRLLRQLAQTFVVQQRAVELAYGQVDNALLTLNAPPDPRADASAGAAAQTEQLLQVQAALVRAQNDLYTSWVRYLNARMGLYLDLELLPLNERGLWSEEPAPIDSDRAPATVPAKPVQPLPLQPVLAIPPAGFVPQPLPAVVQPERLPDPLPTNRVSINALPVLSLPDPDAAQSRQSGRSESPDAVGRPDPFPPIDLPTPDRGAGGTVLPPQR